MSNYDEGYDEGYSAGRDELWDRIAELEEQLSFSDTVILAKDERIAELEHELERCQFCYDKTLPLADRIAELEAERLRLYGRLQFLEQYYTGEMDDE